MSAESTPESLPTEYTTIAQDPTTSPLAAPATVPAGEFPAPRLEQNVPPPPPLPEPVMVYAPPRAAAAAASQMMEAPPLRLSRVDGPDPEDQIVPMMLDRSASEPSWPGAPRPPVASIPRVEPAAAAPRPIQIAALPLPAGLAAPVPAQQQEPIQLTPAMAEPLPEPAQYDGPTADDVRQVFAARAGAQVRRRGWHPFWWAMAGVMASAVVVFAVLVGTHQVDWFDSWEAQITPQVQQLKGEAETLAARGEMKESHEKYREIEKLMAGREARDPTLQRAVEEARQDARRVYNVVLMQAAAAAQQKTASAAPIQPATPVTPGPATPIARTEPPPPGPAIAPAPTIEPPPAKPIQDPPPAVPPKPRATVHNRPAPRPAPPNRGELTDEQIGQSIQDGVDYLLKQFDNRTHTLRGRGFGDDSYSAGMNALAVYALLQAGQAISDPRLSHRGEEMRALIDAMKAIPMTGQHLTYARALRATCLALFNRPEDFKTLSQDVDWLVGTTEGGAYSYAGVYKPPAQRGNFTLPKNGGMGWDNSNAQYGLLGVWSGVEAEPRIEVPLAYWKAVDRHWSTNQNNDGQWGYGFGGNGGRLSMTCAGIASLFVAHEYIEPPLTTGTVGRDPFPPALKKALTWFEQGNNSVSLRDGNWWGYALYGIERVGLASGFKHFGKHDWYRELADQAVRRQLADGSWGESVVDTSYALLFLARGRHPIMMNKLRFDGYWSNRPRDAANVARFAGRQLERPLNWQVVNVDNPWTDWTDSPILYIASHEAPKLTDEHVEKLRKFVEGGGMIFTHADAGSPAFDKWARELAAKLFKQYEMKLVPETHPLWTTVFKVAIRPQLFGVSNGSRLLMVHSPSDIALKWQQRGDRVYEGDKKGVNIEQKNNLLSNFHLAVNLFVYGAGKRDLRNRLESAWMEEPSARPIDTIHIGRIRHDGNWDPEPGAWRRYSNWFIRETGTKLEIDTLKASELRGDMVQTMPVVHITGTARANFSDADAKAVRDFVQAGGVVLIDSTGGLNAFDVDVRATLLPKAFVGEIPRLIDTTHPVLNAGQPGMADIAKARLRPYVVERMGSGIGTFQMIVPKPDVPTQRPGAVIITSLDLTTGLLGANTWGVLGFDPAYSQALVKNVIFWTLDGTPQ
jgi:hypothetical protein